ncbi:MAG: potassium channel family protein [Chthoniobacterales bacterium]
MHLVFRWPRRHFALLLTLIAVLLIQPLSQEWGGHRVFHDTLSTLVALAVLLFVFDSNRERLISLGLVLPGILASLLRYVFPATDSLPLELVVQISSLFFYGYAAGVILVGIIERRAVRADDVVGAICSYVLLGLCWSSLYQTTELLAPGSFAVHSDLAVQLDDRKSRQALFNYFSFVTLTTLGYGDVTPVSHVAATFAWLEATFGQFYIAVVVAQIVGFRLAQGDRRRVARIEESPDD